MGIIKVIILKNYLSPPLPLPLIFGPTRIDPGSGKFFCRQPFSTCQFSGGGPDRQNAVAGSGNSCRSFIGCCSCHVHYPYNCSFFRAAFAGNFVKSLGARWIVRLDPCKFQPCANQARNRSLPIAAVRMLARHNTDNYLSARITIRWRHTTRHQRATNLKLCPPSELTRYPPGCASSCRHLERTWWPILCQAICRQPSESGDKD